MNEESDAQLVVRARRRDSSAVEALVRRYLRPAYVVALSIVRHVADAEDLSQDVLATSMQRLEQCREPERFSSWLFQAVRNRALNHLQQGKMRAGHLGTLEREGVVELDVRSVLVRTQLLAALEQLSESQRQVVLLHDLENWTHAEIATALGISEVMSRQHLHIARKAMRAFLSGATKEDGHG